MLPMTTSSCKWQRKKSSAADVFVDARAFFPPPAIHAFFRFTICVSCETVHIELRPKPTPLLRVSLPHTKCERERVCVCVHNEKSLFEAKNFITIILYFIIKSNFVPPPTTIAASMKTFCMCFA